MGSVTASTRYTLDFHPDCPTCGEQAAHLPTIGVLACPYCGCLAIDYTDTVDGPVLDYDRQHPSKNDVLPALAAARRTLDDADSLSTTTVPDRLGGDLAEMVERAVDAFCECHESAAGLLSAARTALAGGEDGCRELAAHARDGYAHPLAHLLLHGIIADGESATEIQTKAFDFEPDDDSDTDGTGIRSVQRDRETVLVDRNHQGATVRNPPAF